MKKITTIIALLLFLSFVLVSVSEIGIVKAESTIYIREDGSVEGTDKLQRNGNVYTLTDNIDVYKGSVSFSAGIKVERNDVVIDGCGYSIQAQEYVYSGIDLTERSNVTIKNMHLCGFEYGIYLQSSSRNTIYGNNITANGFGGIKLASFTINSVVVGCSLNSIYNNNITGNSGEGISLNTSPKNNIHDNNITNNGYDGLYLDRSSYNNTILRNDIKNNGRDGIICLIYSGGNRISGNYIANNKGNGVTLTLNSNVNIISENNILNNTHGININNSEYPSNNTISGNNITSNNVGIGISASSDNRIYHNNFVNNTLHESITFDSFNVGDNDFEGNYWDDYAGVDNDGDGIGDTPYIIDQSNQDNYPRMEVFIIPEFPSWTPTLLVLIVLAVAVAVYKRKLPKTANSTIIFDA